MVDIHCHILPGLDDGARDFSDSVEMAELAYNSGVHDIIVTPHCNIPDVYENYWNPQMEQLLLCTQKKLEQKNIPVSVYPGQEVFLAHGYIERLREGKLMTLNRSRYLLVEFDLFENMSAAMRQLYRIISEGCVPIVAHPERYNFVIRSHDAADELKKAGAFIQLNRGSIKGSFGPDVREAAEYILKTRQADFIASDAHSPYRRTPYLADIYEFIYERFSKDYADYLLYLNPRSVLENRNIYHY